MPLALIHTRELLQSLRDNDWYITGFPFHFNGHDYAVVFEDLREIDRGTKLYAVCLTFIDTNNEKRRLETYANAYNFRVDDEALFSYFGIKTFGNNRGNPIFSLYKEFNDATPTKYSALNKNMHKYVLNVIDHREDNEGFCCYEARHNPCVNGIQYMRSAKNTAKTKLLRPNLYKLIGDKDKTISFCYRQNNPLPDHVIIANLGEQ